MAGATVDARHQVAGDRTAAQGSLGHSRTVLLLVDFVNPLDFDGAEKLAAPALAAARATAMLKEDARRKGICTIYANDNYGLWQSDFEALRQRCVRAGGAAGALAALLRPAPGDLTILKPRHSGFYCTPLELLLQQLQCRRVVVAGLATDNCVLFTAMDAYVRGYEVWVPADCTAAESRRVHRAALGQMQRLLKAHVDPAFAAGARRAVTARASRG